MKTITTTFILSKQGNPLGEIIWQRQKDGNYCIEGSGSLSGDKQAVDAFYATVAQAVHEEWKNHFLLPPDDRWLDDPLFNGVDFLSLLIQAGFDAPPELEQFRPLPESEEDDDPLLQLDY